MDWLILLLLVPAIVVPLVLLCGFAGCAPLAQRCESDDDCPAGTRCIDGQCFAIGEPRPPPSAPADLAASARSDRAIALSWTNTEPAATGFQIERAPEDGDFAVVLAVTDPSSTGVTDTAGLEEATTYIYQARALIGQDASAPSEPSTATAFPAAPINLIATGVDVDRIELSWTNASHIAQPEFSLQRRLVATPPSTFAQIFRGPDTSFSDNGGLAEGTAYEYQVIAIVEGFQNTVAQEVRSSPSGIVAATTLAFQTAFAANLTDDQAGLEGFCLIQKISSNLLTNGGTTKTRITLRGSSAADLTLDTVSISQVDPAGDAWDAAPDLKVIASAVTLPANTAQTFTTDYALDNTQDLLIAYDISAVAGNVRSILLTGAPHFFKAGAAQASVQDRTSDFTQGAQDRLYLVEKIEVL